MHVLIPGALARLILLLLFILVLQVTSPLSALTNLLTNPAFGLTMTSMEVPGVWCGAGHNQVVWCNQLIKRLGLLLLELVRQPLISGSSSSANSSNSSTARQKVPLLLQEWEGEELDDIPNAEVAGSGDAGDDSAKQGGGLGEVIGLQNGPPAQERSDQEQLRRQLQVMALVNAYMKGRATEALLPSLPITSRQPTFQQTKYEQSKGSTLRHHHKRPQTQEQWQHHRLQRQQRRLLELQQQLQVLEEVGGAGFVEGKQHTSRRLMSRGSRVSGLLASLPSEAAGPDSPCVRKNSTDELLHGMISGASSSSEGAQVGAAIVTTSSTRRRQLTTRQRLPGVSSSSSRCRGVPQAPAGFPRPPDVCTPCCDAGVAVSGELLTPEDFVQAAVARVTGGVGVLGTHLRASGAQQQQQGGEGGGKRRLLAAHAAPAAAQHAFRFGVPFAQQQEELAKAQRDLTAAGSGSRAGTVVQWNASALQQQPDGSSMVVVIGAAKPCLGFRVWVQLGRQGEEKDAHLQQEHHERRLTEQHSVSSGNSTSNSSSTIENQVQHEGAATHMTSSGSGGKRRRGGRKGRWLDVTHLAAPVPPLWDDQLMDVRISRCALMEHRVLYSILFLFLPSKIWACHSLLCEAVEQV